VDKTHLSKSEFDLANNALEGILGEPVEDIDLTDTVPPLADVSDSNKVFKGKLSILFVDMRKSTDLTDELKAKKMVKVYRAFIRMIIQAIRYSGGYTRQFAGDGIMGVFQDSTENEKTILSSQKAVTAARYIHTLVDYCLNPALKKHLTDVCVACGIGICTGTIMITKVGMRGKEADDAEENETGIVWVGSTTNYANRHCGLANPREIFIDERTYESVEEKELWSKSSRTKGSKIFTGYTVTDYYLVLQEGITQEAVKAEEQSNPEINFIQNIFDETQERALLLVDEISKKSAELAIALKNVKMREDQVSIRENNATKENNRLQQWKRQLDSKQVDVDRKEEKNKKDEYNIYIQLFKTVHCKRGLAIALGKDFWEEKLKLLILCGSYIGKSEKEVKSEICYALVDLYQNLDEYDLAYDALCIQAETHPWIHAFTVENILSKTYLRTQLKSTIENRLNTALKPDIRKSLQECLSKIK